MNRKNDVREADEQPTSKGWGSRFDARLKKLWWRAHWLNPQLVPGPFTSDQDFWRTRDERDNLETSLPSDEELRVEAVWGMEVFGPNESDRLYRALDKLQWNSGGTWKAEGALTWIRQQRTYSVHGGAWYNVGPVVRRSDAAKFWSHANYGTVPAEVDYLLVQLHQVVSAVTCVVVCFVLKPEAALVYERELNASRSSKRRRAQRWSVAHLGPFHLKQEAIEGARLRMRKLVRAWFRENLPGHFSMLQDADRFPAAELLSTSLADLLGGVTEALKWQRIVANPGIYDVWTSQQSYGLRFTVEERPWPMDTRSHIIANLPRTRISEQDLQTYGGGRSAYVARVNETLEGVLHIFAVKDYLLELAKDIKVAREAMHTDASKKNVLKTITRVQRFFDATIGIPTAARELIESTGSVARFRHECKDFTAAPWRAEEPRHLSEHLRQHVRVLAKRLLDDESSTREQLEQLSAVLSVRESIKAQRATQRLAVAAFVVAFASMIAAFAAVPDRWIVEIFDAWARLIAPLQ